MDAIKNPLEIYTEIAVNFVIWITFGGRLKSMFPTKTSQIYTSRSPCAGLQTISLHHYGGENGITTKVIKNKAKEGFCWVTAPANLISILSIELNVAQSRRGL